MHRKSVIPGTIRSQSARDAFVVIVFLVAAATGLARPATAVEMTSLYTVDVPLDPNESNARRTAYRVALTEVLIRMTGSTGIAESEELMSMFPNPERYVRQFQPGPDDTLIVSLYGEEIERVLRQAGAPIWGADRPLTLIWLAVDRGMGEREIVGADDQGRAYGVSPLANDRNEMLRDRVKEVATRRGIPVAFPLLDTTDLASVSFSDIWGGFDEQLIAASQRYEASSVIVGRIRPETPQAHRWTWYRDGQRQDWSGEPEEAINLLADAIAATDALAGNDLGESMQLTISGISSVKDYGQVQQYMEGLRVLDRLMIKTVDADRITYEVEVRGGADRLRAALALSGILVPVESAGAIDPDPYAYDSKPVGSRMREPGDGRSFDYFFRRNERRIINRDVVPN